MTNDYRIILPLMLAVVVSLLLSQRLQKESVYTLALSRKGLRLQHGRDVEVLEAITVGEVMHTGAPALRESEKLTAAYDQLMQLRSHGLPVVNEAGELTGILTLEDIERAQSNGLNGDLVGEVCTRELLVAHPEESLSAALRRMSARDVGRLPVVSREAPRRLLGLLRRADLIRAYDVALTRRATLRHRAAQVRLGALSGVNVEAMSIETGAVCVNRRLGEVAWPQDCIIATIRRGRQVMIPRGDTMLQAGDVLAIVAEGEAREAVRQICSGK